MPNKWFVPGCSQDTVVEVKEKKIKLFRAPKVLTPLMKNYLYD